VSVRRAQYPRRHSGHINWGNIGRRAGHWKGVTRIQSTPVQGCSEVVLSGQGQRLVPPQTEDFPHPPRSLAAKADDHIVPAPALAIETQPIMGTGVEPIGAEVNTTDKGGEFATDVDDDRLLMIRAERGAGEVEQHAAAERRLVRTRDAQVTEIMSSMGVRAERSESATPRHRGRQHPAGDEQPHVHALGS
jgi:hypothetical protein